MSKRLFAFAALAATLPLIGAQAQPAPSGYFLTSPAQRNTYAAVVTALAPAASATDFFTITGAAGKIVQVREIGCTGTSTAAGSLAVTLTKRSTANSAGTSTTMTNVPFNSGNAAASAVVKAYTANPTTGTAVGVIASGLLATVAPASSGVNGFDLRFTDQLPTLVSASQVLALNAGGASFTSGASLTCRVVWTEF